MPLWNICLYVLRWHYTNSVQEKGKSRFMTLSIQITVFHRTPLPPTPMHIPPTTKLNFKVEGKVIQLMEDNKSHECLARGKTS